MPVAGVLATDIVSMRISLHLPASVLATDMCVLAFTRNEVFKIIYYICLTRYKS